MVVDAVRAVKCPVKSGNERNPHTYLPFGIRKLPAF